MHGADRDIVWLQRDFGIYICNMFDTGQVLSLSIAFLDTVDRLRNFVENESFMYYYCHCFQFLPKSDQVILFVYWLLFLIHRPREYWKWKGTAWNTYWIIFVESKRTKSTVSCSYNMSITLVAYTKTTRTPQTKNQKRKVVKK